MNGRWLLKQAALLFAVLVIVSPVILFFVWMLSLSVKYEIDNAASPPILIPERFAWKNYLDVLESNRFSTYFVNSLQIAAEMVAMGSGIAILPVVMAQARSDLVSLRDLQDANQSELWLLTHPESRHLRRIATVYGHLAQVLRMP